MTGRSPHRRPLAAAAALCAIVCACGESQPQPSASRGPAIPAEPAVPDGFTPREVELALRLSPLPPLPADPTNRFADDADAAHFGQFLFFDERLSKGERTSCATCHEPELSFADGRALSVGVLPLDRHAPALWNLAYNRWFFWDGRADTLWAQALVPLESPLEHASSRLSLAHLVYDDLDLREAYQRIFGELPDLDDEQRFPPGYGRPVPTDDHAHVLARKHAQEAPKNPGGRGHTHDGSDFYHPHQRAWDSMQESDRDAVTRVFVNIGKSIAAYQRKLISRRAPFDVFVEGLREHDLGKQAALDAPARRGLQLFVGKARCVLCHHGPTLSDMEFHNIRVPPSKDADVDDPGRSRGLTVVQANEFRGTSRWSDDAESARDKLDFLPAHGHAFGEFKTPSLRNVAVTPPYMHQGQIATLAEVVEFYSTLEGANEDPRALERTLVPLNLSEDEKRDLIAFLESLTDVAIDPELNHPPATPSRH